MFAGHRRDCLLHTRIFPGRSQVYPNEYDLILRPDINTRGHTQWFFFTMSNTRKVLSATLCQHMTVQTAAEIMRTQRTYGA